MNTFNSRYRIIGGALKLFSNRSIGVGKLSASFLAVHF